MKNKSTLKIIIVAVLVLIALVAILFIKSLNKKVYTEEEYTKILKNYNYKVVDKSNDYSHDSTVKSYLQAKNKEKTYQVDFFIMDSKESAKEYYTNVKNELKRESNGIKAIEVNYQTGFDKYIIEANGNYSVIIRSKNTIIYSNTKSTNKEKINTLIRILQY